MLPCDICGKTVHSWFDCPQRGTKPPGWKPDRLITQPGKLIAEVPAGTRITSFTGKVIAVAPDTPPGVLRGDKFEALMFDQPKRGKGRPRSIDDMKAYKAEKQRIYRARIKAEKESGK